MLVVVDASAAAAFLLPSQSTKASAAFLDGWRDHIAWAPYVFSLEVRGLLLRQERRTRAPGLARIGLRHLGELAVELADAPDLEAQADAFALALSGNMGFLDAMYLLTTAELGAVLISKDQPQLAAARAFGLDVLDLS